LAVAGKGGEVADGADGGGGAGGTYRCDSGAAVVFGVSCRVTSISRLRSKVMSSIRSTYPAADTRRRWGRASGITTAVYGLESAGPSSRKSEAWAGSARTVTATSALAVAEGKTTDGVDAVRFAFATVIAARPAAG
jgi:hypothetical protein